MKFPFLVQVWETFKNNKNWSLLIPLIVCRGRSMDQTSVQSGFSRGIEELRWKTWCSDRKYNISAIFFFFTSVKLVYVYLINLLIWDHSLICDHQSKVHFSCCAVKRCFSPSHTFPPNYCASPFTSSPPPAFITPPGWFVSRQAAFHAL